MENTILKFIKDNNLIKVKDKIVCGVSGGPDSMCMLDNLRKIKKNKLLDFELIVVHINHMIREEAIEDEQYVENYCKNHNIKFYLKRVDVTEYANNNKMGLEEAGRKVRYGFFEEILEKENAQKIAIAHNKNDKAETIIMNLLRGSGISGLKGIEAIRENKFIRPILDIERTEIEQYCEENKLNPRIDKTNFINDCTRNKIRNIVIPYIKNEFNSNIIEALNRLSIIISEEDIFLLNYTKEIFNEILIKEDRNQIILNLKLFNKQEKVIKKRIIIYSINKVLGTKQNIQMVNIEDIVKLCSNNIGNKYLNPNKNVRIFVNKGKIYFCKEE